MKNLTIVGCRNYCSSTVICHYLCNWIVLKNRNSQRLEVDNWGHISLFVWPELLLLNQLVSFFFFLSFQSQASISEAGQNTSVTSTDARTHWREDPGAVLTHFFCVTLVTQGRRNARGEFPKKWRWYFTHSQKIFLPLQSFRLLEA